MTEIIKKLENFLGQENNFIIKLRNLDGLDTNSVDEFKQILLELKLVYENTDRIEKYIPFLLLEVIPATTSSFSFYSEEEKQLFAEAIAEIEEAILGVFS